MEILSAIELKKYIYRKQIEIIYSKIIEAAKNFRNELYFNCDFKLEEKAINYFKKLCTDKNYESGILQVNISPEYYNDEFKVDKNKDNNC